MNYQYLQMIDRFLYAFFGKLDNITDAIGNLFAPRCKCKKNDKKN